MKSIIFLILGILLSSALFGQTKVVYGKVRLFDDLSISNILVTAKKAGTKALTDSMGNYTIVCFDKDVLTFESKVFEKERRRVTPKKDTINVQMHFIESPESVQMAVGYGYITKENATHAQSMITSDQVDFCSYSNIFDLISGRCPGVRINNVSNMPGAEQEVIIRGITSITLSNCALYVVDGVITQYIGDISPCDVKSINFLKDAAASIYGARGATGVVLIETIASL